MTVELRPLSDEQRPTVVRMITDFYNLHRRLTHSPEKFMQTDESSEKCLRDWEGKGKDVQTIWKDDMLAGFLAVRHDGDDAAFLEELYVSPEHRGGGTGRAVIEELDRRMREKGTLSMFVDVIPRNEEALRFYLSMGFDHLNLVQLRKNYDSSLDKDEEIVVLGHRMKKY